jgi:hypothetical protein
MSPSELEFLINLIGEKISKTDAAFRKVISVQERLALTLSPLYFTFTKTLKKPHNTADSHHFSRQKYQQ